MATTTPDNLWSPDGGDAYALTTDLAAMQDTVQDALTDLRTDFTSGRSVPYKGTSSDRGALTGMSDGDTFQDLDGLRLKWEYRSTQWFVVPGQVLASMVGPTTNSIGNGTAVGSVISTPPLPIGQRVKIVSSFSQYITTGTGTVATDTKVRNNSADVSLTTFDISIPSRAYSNNAGVTSGRGANFLFTTTVAAKVSAGLWVGGGATSAVFGADGTFLRIESA